LGNSDYFLAWLEEAKLDFQAAKILMESGFHQIAVFLGYQASAKAFKAIFLKFEVPDGTKLHPEKIFEDLLKKDEGAVLRAFSKQLERLLKGYKSLEKESAACRFPVMMGEKIFAPHREFKALHSARALSIAREILGLAEKILRQVI